MVKYFLLAAGLGKRAQPLSLIKPKPLFPLDGIPLIQLILEQLARKEITRGFVNLHHLPDQMAAQLKSHENITIFYEKTLTGSKILSRSFDLLEGDYLLVINGDIFLDIPVNDMIEKIGNSNADGILLVRRDDTCNYSSLLHEGDKLKGVGPPRLGGLIYLGVALLKPSVVQCVRERNFFQTLKKHGFDIRMLNFCGLWLDIGDPHSYYKSNFIYKNVINGSKSSNSLSKEVQVSPDSLISGSIIWENTVIQNNSRISDSIITGYTTLDHIVCTNKIITKHEVYSF